MKKFLTLSLVLVLFSLYLVSLVHAQETSIIGKWKTIDDKTNEPKSIVEIYKQDGKYFGKIIELFRKPGEDPNPVCDKCSDKDPRKNQPTKGMVIIQNLTKKGSEFSGGTILDPKEGKIYTCKLWVEGDQLMVRGYIAFFFRTQTWQKAD